jgi:hypothetical protein
MTLNMQVNSELCLLPQVHLLWSGYKKDSLKSCVGFKTQQLDAVHITTILQVNNEPSLLFQVKLLCEVVAENISQGKTPLEAVAAVNTYFQIKNASECYEYDPQYILIGTSLASYSYQCCTQVRRISLSQTFSCSRLLL